VKVTTSVVMMSLALIMAPSLDYGFT
jgi:hypothetical protein